VTTVIESKEMKNRRRVFKDREEAGRVLGRMLLQEDRFAGGVLVLAIPMGGIPVALKVRDALACPLDLVIVRKLQIPGNTEAGFGAMTAEGDIFLNEPLLTRLGLTRDQVDRESARVQRELAERNRRLRSGRPFPDLSGRSVIVVDDGLASGFTMKASVHMVKQRNAARTIVAVPTAPRRSIDRLTGLVDEVYCPNTCDSPVFAVADAYENWYDLSAPEIEEMLAGLQPQYREV
jgi:predicted phosphoribosyltransferase